ncbi:hypothetical protein BDY24DRAFT_403502 [Mrakia frigida]|uniref:uncharacterized protein n=1 Tax=Mrakia frigida TaxID=29902 RepID=UPI003FCBF98A
MQPLLQPIPRPQTRSPPQQLAPFLSLSSLFAFLLLQLTRLLRMMRRLPTRNRPSLRFRRSYSPTSTSSYSSSSSSDDEISIVSVVVLHPGGDLPQPSRSSSSRSVLRRTVSRVRERSSSIGSGSGGGGFEIELVERSRQARGGFLLDVERGRGGRGRMVVVGRSSSRVTPRGGGGCDGGGGHGGKRWVRAILSRKKGRGGEGRGGEEGRERD